MGRGVVRAYLNAPMVPCKCGCGTLIHAMDDHYRTIDYVKGHTLRYGVYGSGMGRDYAENFWSRVNKTDTCWLWTGHCAIRPKTGEISYGKFTKDITINETSTHRISWVLSHGPIPPGLCVLHSCDNPPCVNPEHLLLGTHSDNMQDKSARGRLAVYGDVFLPSKKLNWDIVHSVREEFKSKGSEMAKDFISRMAVQYEVSWYTMDAVVYGVNWREDSRYNPPTPTPKR